MALQAERKSPHVLKACNRGRNRGESQKIKRMLTRGKKKRQSMKGNRIGQSTDAGEPGASWARIVAFVQKQGQPWEN